MGNGPVADIRTIGAPRLRGFDLYYRVLRARSWKLLLVFLLGFLLFNLAFAGLLLLQPGALGHSDRSAEITPFARAFFFSVQTLLTIGYGNIYPNTLFANLIVMVESLCGLLMFAIITGLVFARVSRPTARILFSRVAAVGDSPDGPALSFRIVNRRHDLILDARARAVLLRLEPAPHGGSIRRFHDLPLTREANPLFALTWQLSHPIDAQSPLAGATAETMAANGDEILVLLTGTDEVLGTPISARFGYTPERLRWNHRLADMIRRAPDGRPTLDYTALHRTEPLAAAGATPPAG